MGSNKYLMAGSWQDQLGLLVCTDSSSNILWSKTYSGGAAPAVFPDMSFDYLCNVSDSTFLVTGTVVEPIATGNPYRGLIMLLDSAGNTIWAKKVVVPGEYVQLGFAEKTMDGGFVFTGTSGNPVTSAPYRFIVVKTDSVGNTQWSKLYSGGNHTNSGRVIRELMDSSFILTGFIENLNPFQGSAALIHLSATGSVIYAVELKDTLSSGGIPNFISGCDLAVLQDGGYLIYANSPSGGSQGIIRTDSAGHIIWQKSFITSSSGGGTGIYPGYRMLNCDDGNYIFTAQGFSGFIFKTDTAGNPIWSASTNMILYDAIESGGGFLHLVGAGPLLGVNPAPEAGALFEAGIVHVDEMSLSGQCVFPAQITALPSSNISTVFVPQEISSGQSIAFAPFAAICTLQSTNGCVDVLGGFTETTGDIGSIQISPNPGNGLLTCNLDYIGGRLIITNVLGEIIYNRIVNENRLNISLENQPSGLFGITYLYKGKKLNKKILLVR